MSPQLRGFAPQTCGYVPVVALRPYVDHDRCVSSGACILEFPQAFAYQQGQALAVVLPGADELTDEQLREAASLCPVEAIRLFDADGNDVTPEI
jgi:ferredoxin